MAHKHQHHHHHVAEDPLTRQELEEMDSGNRSLSEALRVSFVILKIIMVVLVMLYLASGIFTVENNEVAIVLRFGKVVTQADNTKLLESGLHWSLPYPVDEVVKIPWEATKTVALDSFWYYETEQEKLGKKSSRVPRTLNPKKDGYCLTRGEAGEGVAENDYNIVHSKWEISYNIEKNPYEFFKNIQVEKPKPGEVYADVLHRSIQPMLNSLAEDAIVTTMVNFTIDQAITYEKTAISEQARKLLQSKLDAINSGINIKSLQVVFVWPRQVDNAFQQSIIASQQKKSAIIDAQSYYDKTVNEAEGPAQEKISQAKAYRTRVVESAKANANYLAKLLPEYRLRPELVVQRIYQDAVEQVLADADEKLIVQPSQDGKQREFRVLISRDPAAKKKSKVNK